MCVHMAGLMRGSVRPCGVSSSRSGEGSSVARAAVSHNATSCRQHQKSPCLIHKQTHLCIWPSCKTGQRVLGYNKARLQIEMKHTECKKYTNNTRGTHNAAACLLIVKQDKGQGKGKGGATRRHDTS